MHLYNLILAGIWLALGAWLLIYDYLRPGGGLSFRLGEIEIQLGLVALALAGYNLLRWWSRRAAFLARQVHEEMTQRREQARRDREFRESGRQPDPDFKFDEPPRTDA